MTKKPIESKAKTSAPSVTPGLIPESGLITAEELARRLDLQNLPHLKTELESLGINYVAINGKRVYRCSDIGALIPSPKKGR